MNATETLAYEWLCGHGYHGVTFHPKDTPDFTTNEGLAVEVKYISVQGRIGFRAGQIAKIAAFHQSLVLVYGRDHQILTSIPRSVIMTHPPMYDGVVIGEERIAAPAPARPQHCKPSIVPMLTPVAVAARLECSNAEVMTLLRTGQLRGRQLTKATWRVSEADLQAFTAPKPVNGG